MPENAVVISADEFPVSAIKMAEEYGPGQLAWVWLKDDSPSKPMNRKGWTNQQWIDDARRLMNEIDGAVTSLLNGHVITMLSRLEELEELDPEDTNGFHLQLMEDYATIDGELQAALARIDHLTTQLKLAPFDERPGAG